jgi:elongation factor Tu
MKIKRSLAFFIDFSIVCFLYAIVSFIAPLHDISLIITFLLLIFKDITFRNASIGKKIMNIEIRGYNNKLPNLTTIILRNVFLILWPIEILIFLIYNKSIGDMIFGTKIIDTKSVTFDIINEKKLDLSPDVEVVFKFNGARRGPAYSGYRPAHLIKDDYLTTGVHNYIKPPIALPTSEVFGTIKFMTPEVYPHCLWIGKIINIQEGEKIVGSAQIIKILNPILELEDKEEIEKRKNLLQQK